MAERAKRDGAPERERERESAKMLPPYCAMEANLSRIPDDIDPSICVIQVPRNHISDVSALSLYPMLHTLELDHNRISEDTVFPPCPALQYLSLNQNRISDIAQFLHKNRESFPSLRTLCLIGNPGYPDTFTQQRLSRLMRVHAVSEIPTLRSIDYAVVESTERRRSKHLSRLDGQLFSISGEAEHFRPSIVNVCTQMQEVEDIGLTGAVNTGLWETTSQEGSGRDTTPKKGAAIPSHAQEREREADETGKDRRLTYSLWPFDQSVLFGDGEGEREREMVSNDDL
ncbi:hypothetical protein KIPB_000588 [Kipferlia bialata]|uniref:Uncharacterized protein n=1 Tax=Kipferlia bialata TaxID=797122 RepID=A0A9K3CPF9_9EUKA|nr:hypothetical protein KIPB_000588 [Kipferlia bialata]|eukprot:g588.t1